MIDAGLKIEIISKSSRLITSAPLNFSMINVII